ncbi:MAG: hypothetical protein AAGA30_07645 [Planctomycetota bacterium]
MRNLILASLVTLLLVSTVGCANGPMRKWLRGAPCSACNPSLGQPANTNLLGACNTDGCATCATNTSNATGNGLLGGLFRNETAAPPASIPGSAFDQPAAGTLGSEIYGNPVNAGRMEIPPSTPFN